VLPSRSPRRSPSTGWPQVHDHGSGRSGETRSVGVERPARTICPASPALRAASVTNLVLPTPASPVTATQAPRPPAARLKISASAANSSSRPTTTGHHIPGIIACTPCPEGIHDPWPSADERHQPPSQTPPCRQQEHTPYSPGKPHTAVSPSDVADAVPRSSRSALPGHREPVNDRQYGIGDLAASGRGQTEPGAKTPSSMAAAFIAPMTHEYADPSTIMRHEHALLLAWSCPRLPAETVTSVAPD
jgi:hypothetical protein